MVPRDADNGAVSVVISIGTVEFSGTNTYTGPTYLSSGVLVVDSPAAVSGTGLITYGGIYTVNGNFTAHPGTMTLDFATINGLGAIDSPLINVRTTTFIAPIVGSGSIVMNTNDVATISDIAGFTGLFPSPPEPFLLL